MADGRRAPIIPTSIQYSNCLAQGITPLVGTRAPNRSRDQKPDQRREGVTNIAQGLAWAWRVVSPGVPFDEADPNPTGLHERAIVLLTDGEQYGRATKDGYNRPSATNWTPRPAPGMDARLKAIAANVKAGGVKIYVIQFANANTDLEKLLKNHVATAPYRALLSQRAE